MGLLSPRFVWGKCGIFKRNSNKIEDLVFYAYIIIYYIYRFYKLLYIHTYQTMCRFLLPEIASWKLRIFIPTSTIWKWSTAKNHYFCRIKGKGSPVNQRLWKDLTVSTGRSRYHFIKNKSTLTQTRLYKIFWFSSLLIFYKLSLDVYVVKEYSGARSWRILIVFSKHQMVRACK